MGELIRISYKSFNFEVFNGNKLYDLLMHKLLFKGTIHLIKTNEYFPSIRVFDKFFNFLIQEINNEDELTLFSNIFLSSKKIISIIGSAKHYSEYTKDLCTKITHFLKNKEDVIFLTGGTTGIPADITRSLKDQTYNLIPDKDWDYIVDGIPVYSDNGALFYKMPIKLDERSYLLGTVCDEIIMCSGSTGSFYEFLNAFLKDKKLYLFPDIEGSPSYKFLKEIKQNDYSMIKDYESEIEKYVYESCWTEFYSSIMSITDITTDI